MRDGPHRQGRGGGADGDRPGRFDVELHTGQIGRYASPEEMAELETLELPDYYRDTTATPGIERTVEKPTPIDGTAARVTRFQTPAGDDR